MEDNDVQEAKEYFRNIVLGKKRTLPIVRLHGHRSQAPARVHTACGKTIEDLKIFLMTHPETFTVIGDDVTCTEDIEAISENPMEEVEKKKDDVLEAKEYFRNIVLAEKRTLAIVRVHGHRSQAPANVRRACGKSVADLKKFLLKYPETFTVIGDRVSCKRKKARISEEPKQNITKWLGKNEKKKDKEATSTSPKGIIQGITCHFEGNSWKEWKKSLIATIKDCNSITQDILQFTAIDPMITLSCQTGCYNAKNQLCLLQIATRRGEAFVFDILTCPKMMTEGGLKSLLESENVMKVIHNCSIISAHLQTDFGVLLKTVFDTQSAHAVFQFQNQFQRSVNEVESVSLNALCTLYGAPMNPLEKDLKKVLLRDENYWTRRPLSPDMLLYAVGDVLTLTNKELYQKLSAILPENHALFRELCQDQILRYISPKTVAATGDDRKVLSKLSELNNNNITNNDQDAKLPRIDLTEERPEKTAMVVKNPKVLTNVELDSDECDWECVFEKTSNDLLDLVQRNDKSPSVEMISSGNSESSDDTNVMSLIDSISDDIKMGKMDELEELVVSPAAVKSVQTSVITSMSTTTATVPVHDVGSESQTKIAEEVIPVIDLTEGETSFLPVPVIHNTQNILGASNSTRLSQYDSVLVRRTTDDDKPARKRTAAEVIREYREDPPTKIPCLGLDEKSPAFSPAETDESTSWQSSDPPSPPHIVTWGIHFTYAHKKR